MDKTRFNKISEINDTTDLLTYFKKNLIDSFNSASLAFVDKVYKAYDSVKGFSIIKVYPFPLTSEQSKYNVYAYCFNPKATFNNGEKVLIVYTDKNFIANLNRSASEPITNDDTTHSLKYAVLLQLVTSGGKDGETPFINDKGTWQIGTKDTGVKAEGTDGKTPFIKNTTWWIGTEDTGVIAEGKNGEDGVDGKTPFIKNKNWWIGTQDTGIQAEGENGKDGTDGVDGTDGKDGVGIAEVSLSDDGKLTITKTDGSTPIDNKNVKGSDGITPEITQTGTTLTISVGGTEKFKGDLKGEQGQKGADGASLTALEFSSDGTITPYIDGTKQTSFTGVKTAISSADTAASNATSAAGNATTAASSATSAASSATSAANTANDAASSANDAASAANNAAKSANDSASAADTATKNANDAASSATSAASSANAAASNADTATEAANQAATLTAKFEDYTLNIIQNGSPIASKYVRGAPGQNGESVPKLTAFSSESDNLQNAYLHLNDDPLISDDTSIGHLYIIFNLATKEVYGTPEVYNTYATPTALDSVFDTFPDGDYLLILISYGGCSITQTVRDILNSQFGGCLTSTWTTQNIAHAFIGKKGLTQGQGYEMIGSGSDGYAKVECYLSGLTAIFKGKQGEDSTKYLTTITCSLAKLYIQTKVAYTQFIVFNNALYDAGFNSPKNPYPINSIGESVICGIFSLGKDVGDGIGIIIQPNKSSTVAVANITSTEMTI